MLITASSQVTLHFSLAFSKSEVNDVDETLIDSTFSKEPATFVMGDGSLLPDFEKKLFGLKAGDQKEFILPAAEAFGEVNPDSIHDMPRKQFKGMELSEGLVVSFDGAGKRPMPGVVKKITNDKVTIDFNHPLAGETIHFKVEIIAVEETSMNPTIVNPNHINLTSL